MGSFPIHWLFIDVSHFYVIPSVAIVGNYDEKRWFRQGLMVLVSNHVNKGLTWGDTKYLYCGDICLYTPCILTHYGTLHSKAQF